MVNLSREMSSAVHNDLNVETGKSAILRAANARSERINKIHSLVHGPK